MSFDAQFDERRPSATLFKLNTLIQITGLITWRTTFVNPVEASQNKWGDGYLPTYGTRLLRLSSRTDWSVNSIPLDLYTLCLLLKKSIPLQHRTEYLAKKDALESRITYETTLRLRLSCHPRQPRT
jgi:hypothetical protein